jgi:hypothetical protein
MSGRTRDRERVAIVPRSRSRARPLIQPRYARREQITAD